MPQARPLSSLISAALFLLSCCSIAATNNIQANNVLTNNVPVGNLKQSAKDQQVVTRPLLEFIPPSPTKTAKIIIIIDDVGNNKALGLRTIELKGRVTPSFLPHSPHAKSLAKRAYELGKEAMLHVPMSNLSNKELGPGGLTTEQSQEELVKTLQNDIQAVPYVQGINNHMGSQLTQMKTPMNWVMQELNCRDMYFVDSRTSGKSVAYATAKSYNLAHLGRDVFLDNEQNEAYVAKAFNRLLRIAKRKGLAIAIGHPYPATLSYLEKVIPKLDAMGIELVHPSQVLFPYRSENKS